MAACSFIALLTNCPDAIIVDGLLPINTNIVYTIRDKFDNITTVEVTTDGDGKFTIDPALFPLGIFNDFAGTFELLVYANVQDATNLENQLGLTLCDVEYFSVVFCFTESEAAGAVIPNCEQEQPVDDNTDIPCVTNPIDAFCKSVHTCLGISATANIDLFLNRRGQWVEISGGTVASVNGETGDVILNADDIDETATRFWLTDVLKTAYDAAVTWISTNGANILNHISSTSNPHSTTAAQVGALAPGDNVSELVNDAGYVTVADLSSSITFYPTTAASDVPTYLKLVSDIADPSYNTVAANVSTGAITGSNQLIASLASAQGLIVGQLGIFNVTTIGMIRKTAGGANATATFYFEIYKRTSGGTETLIAVSDNTLNVSSATYVEFSSNALFNDGLFSATDRIVLKFYGNKTGVGADPTFDFQFGGLTPVRTLLPVPVQALLTNYFNKTSDTTNDITDTATNRFVSDTQINTWNAKQNALGFTPENVANKSDSYTVSSSTTYASTKALVDGLAANSSVIAKTPTTIVFTGVVTERAFLVIPLPIGTDNYHIYFKAFARASGTLSSARLRIGTTASPTDGNVGANAIGNQTQIGIITHTNNNRIFYIRNFTILGGVSGSRAGFNQGTSAGSDETSASTATIAVIDTTVQNYIYLSYDLTDAAASWTLYSGFATALKLN